MCFVLAILAICWMLFDVGLVGVLIASWQSLIREEMDLAVNAYTDNNNMGYK